MAPFPPPPSPHCCRTISSFLSHFPSVQDGLTWCCPCLSFLAAACVMLGNECFLFWWGKDFPSGEGIIFAHDSGRLLLLWQFLLPHSVWLVSLLTLRASFLHLIFELEKCSRQSCSGMFYFQASLNCPSSPGLWETGSCYETATLANKRLALVPHQYSSLRWLGSLLSPSPIK